MIVGLTIIALFVLVMLLLWLFLLQSDVNFLKMHRVWCAYETKDHSVKIHEICLELQNIRSKLHTLEKEKSDLPGTHPAATTHTT